MESLINFNYIPQYFYLYIILTAIVIKTFIFIYKNCLRRRIDLIDRYGKDSWVLVTGATDGIGKAFCEELAVVGFNVILVSRCASKLKKVAKEIRESFKVKTHEVEYDFNKRNGLKDYTETFTDLQNKFDMSIVVNNVGTDYHKSWNEFSVEETYELLNLNVFPQTMLTKILFKGLESRKQRSALINLSSFCSDFPFPMKALYSSTKIFDHYLTTALNGEHNRSNIDFMSFKPLGVATKLTGKPADGLSILDARVCVACCLNDLVYEKETYGHWLHKVQAYLINSVPEFILHPFLRNFWYTLIMNVKKNEKIEKIDKKIN